MGSHDALTAAKKAKKDEFYTQRADIEAELQYYAGHFRGKVVYCNCDDPEESEFWKFFVRVFEPWGLKRLIATHYAAGGGSFCYMLDDVAVGAIRTPLRGDGDFRSEECVGLLQESDIVVTNPPFSLFREYVAQLMDYGKSFLIIGNVNAITYKEFFPYIRDNRVWIGPSIHSGDREFRVPDSYPLQAAGWRVDEDGRKYIRVKGVRWFTNMDIPQRHMFLDLRGNYYHGCEDRYPRYDNYDGINVDKVADIPGDYDGVIGVPITFLDKYCPEQFDVIAFRKGDDGKDLVFTRDGARVQPYFRILVRRKKFHELY